MKILSFKYLLSIVFLFFAFLGCKTATSSIENTSQLSLEEYRDSLKKSISRISTYPTCVYHDTSLMQYRYEIQDFKWWSILSNDTLYIDSFSSALKAVLKSKLTLLQKRELPILRLQYAKSIAHILTYKFGYDVFGEFRNESFTTTEAFANSKEGSYTKHCKLINKHKFPDWTDMYFERNHDALQLKSDIFNDKMYRDTVINIINNDLINFRFSQIILSLKEKHKYESYFDHGETVFNRTTVQSPVDEELY